MESAIWLMTACLIGVEMRIGLTQLNYYTHTIGQLRNSTNTAIYRLRLDAVRLGESSYTTEKSNVSKNLVVKFPALNCSSSISAR